MYLIVALSIAIHSCYIGAKVVISLYALQFGASQLVVGVIAALYALVPLMFGVYSGRLADTVGMRPPLIGGAFLVAIGLLAGGIGASLNSLFLAAVLLGAGFVFFNVSIQNLTGAYGPAEKRVRNFTLLSIGYSVSTFIGPMVAGFVIDYAGGYTRAFFVFACFAFLPVVALLVQPQLGRAPGGAKPAEKRSALDLMRIVPVRRLVITSGLIVAAWDLFGFYVPIYGHAIGLSASTIGIILGAYALAAFVPRFTMPAILRRWSGMEVLAGAMLVGAAGFLAFPQFANPYALMAASAVIGLGMGCGQPLSMMMAYEHSPEGRTGEVTGLRLTANNVARVIIPVVAGTLGSAFGTSPVFWATAANLVGVSAMLRRSIRESAVARSEA